MNPQTPVRSAPAEPQLAAPADPVPCTPVDPVLAAPAGTGPSAPVDPPSVGGVRDALAATAELVGWLGQNLWRVTGSDLGDVLGELDQLVAVAGGARVAVTGEALERGEVASSQHAGTAAWVAGHAPSLATGPAPGRSPGCWLRLASRMWRRCGTRWSRGSSASPWLWWSWASSTSSRTWWWRGQRR